MQAKTRAKTRAKRHARPGHCEMQAGGFWKERPRRHAFPARHTSSTEYLQAHNLQAVSFAAAGSSDATQRLCSRGNSFYRFFFLTPALHARHKPCPYLHVQQGLPAYRQPLSQVRDVRCGQASASQHPPSQAGDPGQESGYNLEVAKTPVHLLLALGGSWGPSPFRPGTRRQSTGPSTLSSLLR